jgi:predicted DNA-binding transcriptional regulator AlpA
MRKTRISSPKSDEFTTIEAPACAISSRALLSPQELAVLLNVTMSCVVAWRNRRQGPPYTRISARCIRYNFDDVQAWLAGRQQRVEDRGPRER